MDQCIELGLRIKVENFGQLALGSAVYIHPFINDSELHHRPLNRDSTCRADVSHENCAARRRPRARNSFVRASSFTMLCMAHAISSVFKGSTRIAASPVTSG